MLPDGAEEVGVEDAGEAGVGAEEDEGVGERDEEGSNRELGDLSVVLAVR